MKRKKGTIDRKNHPRFLIYIQRKQNLYTHAQILINQKKTTMSWNDNRNYEINSTNYSINFIYKYEMISF